MAKDSQFLFTVGREGQLAIEGALLPKCCILHIADCASLSALWSVSPCTLAAVLLAACRLHVPDCTKSDLHARLHRN